MYVNANLMKSRKVWEVSKIIQIRHQMKKLDKRYTLLLSSTYNKPVTVGDTYYMYLYYQENKQFKT